MYSNVTVVDCASLEEEMYQTMRKVDFITQAQENLTSATPWCPITSLLEVVLIQPCYVTSIHLLYSSSETYDNNLTFSLKYRLDAVGWKQRNVSATKVDRSFFDFCIYTFKFKLHNYSLGYFKL